MRTEARFSFDASTHTYRVGDDPVVSVTQLLTRAGLVDDTWHDEASAQRGTQVHAICSAYDLGSLALDECTSPWRGYLAAHAKAMSLISHQWCRIEQPSLSPCKRFAGTCDRVGFAYGAATVLDIKTGPSAPWHALQLALYGLLEADEFHLQAEAIARYGLYLAPTGKFKLESFPDRQDLDRARRILKEFA